MPMTCSNSYGSSRRVIIVWLLLRKIHTITQEASGYLYPTISTIQAKASIRERVLAMLKSQGCKNMGMKGGFSNFRFLKFVELTLYYKLQT
jgi:hypothetical protein